MNEHFVSIFYTEINRIYSFTAFADLENSKCKTE